MKSKQLLTLIGACVVTTCMIASARAEEYIELLVRTGDAIHLESKLKKNWTAADHAKEKRGVYKSGYVVRAVAVPKDGSSPFTGAKEQMSSHFSENANAPKFI